MSPLTIVVLAGALVGVGIWLMVTGWVPEREPLSVALGRLGQPKVELAPKSETSLDVRVGRLARRVGVIDRLIVPMRADLRVLHRSPEEQATIIVAYGALGALLPMMAVVAGFAIGAPIPIAIPLWVAFAGAAAGVLVAVKSVRPEATKRRRAFSHALSAFCDVCGMSLAAGRGVESSIETAAHTGAGWPFAELQSTLRAGYVRGETPWDALTRLGNDADLPDLCELAAAISLAGDEGARVRETVASKARAIRERLTSNSERSAALVSERMTIPATFLLFGFVIFLGFPAVAVLFS